MTNEADLCLVPLQWLTSRSYCTHVWSAIGIVMSSV